MARRELYVGKSLSDLDHTLPKLLNRKIKYLVQSSDRLYTEAERLLRDGDEEMAYIHFMKYFKLIKYISKTDDYSRDREYYEKMLGPIKAKTSIEKAELLSISLNQRYDAKYGNHTKESLTNNFVEKRNQPQPQTSKIKANVTIRREILSVKDLYDMLQMQQVGVLIMDCRSQSDFEASRLIYPNCLNVPEEIIHNGMSAGKIQTELSQEGKELWGSRSLKDYIVLMDWNSGAHIQKTPIKTLKNILLSWDQDVNYRNPIMILLDGFEQFQLVYPMMTTNPAYVPSRYQSIEDVDSLEEIEYPDMSIIQMKDNRTFGTDVIGPPKIDRSSKLAAEKAYTVNIDEILRERERLIEQSLKNQKEALEAEYALKAIALKEEQVISDSRTAEKNDLEKRALHNKLMEMEDRATEYEDKIMELKSALETQNTDLTRQEEQIIHRTTESQIEEQRIQMERRKLVDEREQRLLIDRTKKRNIDRSIPKKFFAPAYDRSVKPSSAIISDESVREFHPEPGGKRPGLCGLKNLGNTCYMNSIMQCLSNTVLLKEYFISDDGYKKDRVHKGKDQRHIADEVSAVIREIWLNNHSYISSHDLRRIIGQFQQIFRGMDQQDSHEFLTILMDWLHSDLERDDMTAAPKTKLSASDKAWQDFVKCKESHILNLFYGQIKSTVKCTVCKRESATYEGFSNLSLELPANSNKCDIKECMDMYFFGERISGWNCSFCKGPRDAIKKLDISKLPPILVIHLKRFNVDLESSTNTYKKKQNSVKFPLTGLDVHNYIAPSERNSERVSNAVYNLYGVSNHYGTMERGHYTAFCKSSLDGKWYKYDDHIVSQMDSSYVVSSAGYILFYTTFE